MSGDSGEKKKKKQNWVLYIKVQDINFQTEIKVLKEVI